MMSCLCDRQFSHLCDNKVFIIKLPYSWDVKGVQETIVHPSFPCLFLGLLGSLPRQECSPPPSSPLVISTWLALSPVPSLPFINHESPLRSVQLQLPCVIIYVYYQRFDSNWKKFIFIHHFINFLLYFLESH